MERRSIWDCVTLIEKEGLEVSKMCHMMAKILLKEWCSEGQEQRNKIIQQDKQDNSPSHNVLLRATNY